MTITIISANTTGAYAGDDTTVADTYLKSDVPTTNFGSATTLLSQWNDGLGIEWITLLSFGGLSSIDSDDNVSACSLGLHQYTGSTVDLQISKLLRDWVEAEATWQNWKTSNSWTSGGARGAGDVSAINFLHNYLGGSDTWEIIVNHAQLIADTQDFIDGTIANYGWRFRTTNFDSGRSKHFYSSEDSDTATRPYLLVTHAPPDVVTFYKTAKIETNIAASGIDITILMQRDE